MPKKGASKFKLIKSMLTSHLKNNLLDSLLQILINGPDVFSKENDNIIRRSVKLWMKVKKRKKIAYKTTRGAVGPQAGQNPGAVALQAVVTQAEASTQTEQEVLELVDSKKEQEELAAKVFCLDEENEESVEGDKIGWQDDDDNKDDIKILTEKRLFEQ